MSGLRFIQLILPLKLDWEPFYYVERDTPVCVGSRVFVQFAHRPYVGVVSAVDVTPEEGMNILPAGLSSLPPVLPEEIAFWRSVAEYYLCSVGEVYKAAYPSLKTEKEQTEVRVHERLEKRLESLRAKADKARKDATRERYLQEAARLQDILDGKHPPFLEAGEKGPVSPEMKGKTLLIQGVTLEDRMGVYTDLARKTLSKGRSVLFLVPEIALTRQLEEKMADLFPDLLCYHSGRTAGARRAVATSIRSGAPYIVLGTRSALFLPHRNLGLVVVDEEQDPSYKQDSPAPRYHARESGILLAGIHGAQAVLGSSTPSLESLYNAENGLFTLVKLQHQISFGVELVNLSAEARKRGLSGAYSIKLLSAVQRALEAGGKVLVISRSKAALQEDEAAIRELFPDAAPESIVFATPSTVRLLPQSGFALSAVIQADGLLGKEDFRADEKALQLLQQLLFHSGSQLLIQTREPGHPVFQALRTGGNGLAFLEERRSFGYPPFSRIVDILIKDRNEKRINYLSSDFAKLLRARLPAGITFIGPYAPAQDSPTGEALRCIRLLLPRTKGLRQAKSLLLSTVALFEKDRKYPSHIHLDVDPV